jgi:hypothetical protein
MSEVNEETPEPQPQPQRWSTKRTLAGAGIAFVSILALVVGIIGALNRDDDSDNQYVDEMIESAEADGIELTENEAECVLDVLDDHGLDFDDVANSDDLSEEELFDFGLDVLNECPTLSDEFLGSNDTDADDIDTSFESESFSDSEIENATDSELQEMWWDTPADSDAEQAIEDEMDERGISAGMPAE